MNGGVVHAGEHHVYRLRWSEGGLSLVHSLPFAVDVPTTATISARLAFGADVPNPARGALDLSVTTPLLESARLDLFDLGGRRMRTEGLPKAWSGRIWLDGLRGGIYFARIATRFESHTEEARAPAVS